MFIHIFSFTQIPDLPSLLASLQVFDTTARIDYPIGNGLLTIFKSTDFSPSDITTVQGIVDSTPPKTPQLDAQNIIQNMPIFEKAICLTLIDETNRLRQWIMDFKTAVNLASSLADLKTRVGNLNNLQQVTNQMAIQAVKDKAGTL